MGTENREFSDKLTFLKLLFSVWVVYIHAKNFTIYSLDGTVLYMIELCMSRIFAIAVPSFFIISGYLFFRNYTPTAAPKKLKSRFWSLLVPYVLWNTIYWLIRLGIEQSPFGVRLNYTKTSPTFSSWLFDGLLGEFPLDGPLWFMKVLIPVVAVAPLLYYILRYKWSALVLVTAAVLACACYGHLPDQLMRASVLFYLGGFLSLHQRNLFEERRWSRAYKIAAAVLLSIHFFAGGYIGTDRSEVAIIVYAVLFVAMWILTDGITLNERTRKLISIQFWVYCAHELPLESVEKLWFLVAGDRVLAAWIDFFVWPAVTIAILIPPGFTMRKHCPHVWRVLTGARG